MQPDLRPTGISALGDVPWGLHISLFYKTQNDLLDAVVAYFAAGLEAHELCVWAPSEPAVEQATIDRLRQLVPDVDRRLAEGQLEFFRYQDWFDTAGEMDIALAKAQWMKWEQRAQDEGFAGLRASGNMTWVTPDNARVCHAYERALDDFTVGRRMLILCSYPIASTTADDLFDSTHEHRLVLARRDGEWDVCEIPSLSRSKAELQRLNTELEERVAQRSAQLSATNDDLRREIDERRRVEADLRHSERYLRHAQRLSHTGSFADNATALHPTFWSAETFRIFGLEPRTTPPTHEELVTFIHPADRERLLRTAKDAARDRQGVDVEFRIVCRNGRIRHVRAVTSPVTNDDGSLSEFVGSIIDITDQKLAATRLVRMKRRARERTLKARFAATLEERTRLAREIHDTLLQGVTGIALQLRATLPHLGATPRATADAILRIVELAESTIRDARRAVWDIRSLSLTRSGLPTALEEEARRRANGLDVRFELRGMPRDIPALIEDTIFRVGQEAVINAARHSTARHLAIVLAYEPRQVRLCVEDDGRGFRVDPNGRSHGGNWGLLGMRERAERIDAVLGIRSAEGAGTTIELRVPDARPTERDADVTPRRQGRLSPILGARAPEIVTNADTRPDGR